MANSLSLTGSSQTLHFLYVTGQVPKDVNVTKIDALSKEHLKNNYSINFDSALERISDRLLAERLIHGKLVAAPESKTTVVLKLLFTAIGTAVPIVELLTHVSHYISHSLPPALHLLKEGGELGLELKHISHSHSGHRVLPYKGKRLKIFINALLMELTYRFRHELSLLSPEDCDKLGKIHYEQIIACLEKLAKESDHENLSAAEIFSYITEYIAPDPKQEIQRRIAEYVFDRQSRSVRSSAITRESYLYHFLKQFSQNQDLLKLISNLSQKVLFRDNWFGDKTPKSIADSDEHYKPNNPMIRKLRAYTGTNVPPPSGNSVTFNRAFFTAKFAEHNPLEKVTKSILLLLMREYVMQVIDGDYEACKATNARALDIISSLPNPELAALKAKVAELEAKVNILEGKVETIEEKISRGINPSSTEQAPQFRIEDLNGINQKSPRYNKIIFELFKFEEPLETLNERYMQLDDLEELRGNKILPAHRFWITMQAILSYERTLKSLHDDEAINFFEVWRNADILRSPLRPRMPNEIELN